MYQNLGNQWASSIPAFLALACTPLPFVFHMYGDAIRARSKYAAKAQKITVAMLNETEVGGISPNAPSVAEEAAVETFGNDIGPEVLQKASSVAQKNRER